MSFAFRISQSATFFNCLFVELNRGTLIYMKTVSSCWYTIFLEGCSVSEEVCVCVCVRERETETETNVAFECLYLHFFI